MTVPSWLLATYRFPLVQILLQTLLVGGATVAARKGVIKPALEASPLDPL